MLARRLQAKGTNYKALVDALRHERACDQVAHSSASFASIARDLGFSEASAFNRAFRRWTGQSPGQWRQDARASAAAAPGAGAQSID